MVGCGYEVNIEEIRFIYTIKKGGKGTVEYHMVNITPNEKGKEGKKEIGEFIKVIKSSKQDFFEGYGLKNLKQTIRRDKNGILNFKASGEFQDIFTFIKVLDSSCPHLLYKGRYEKIEWSNDILTIELGKDSDLDDKDNQKSKKKRGEPKENLNLIFKTEGQFLKGTSGQISKDRRTTTMSAYQDLAKLVLIVGDIAEE